MASINIDSLIKLLQSIQKEKNSIEITQEKLRDAVTNNRIDEKNLLTMALDFLKTQPDLATLEDWPPQQFALALFTWFQSRSNQETLAIGCLSQYLQLTLTISQPDSNQLDTALHTIGLNADENQGRLLLECLACTHDPVVHAYLFINSTPSGLHGLHINGERTLL